MVKVWSIDRVTPVVDPGTFVHPTAVLIGDVSVGPDGYIEPGASRRGDMGPVAISSTTACCTASRAAPA